MQILAARNLAAKDVNLIGPPSSDPYVIVRVG